MKRKFAKPNDGTRSIGEKAKLKGYNVIRFPSERGPGSNLAILSDYELLLKPQMIVPAEEITPELLVQASNSLGGL